MRNLNHRSILLPLILGAAIFSALQVRANAGLASGKLSAPAGEEPPASWIDPATGHKVVRVTREPNSASFYFNVNSYTPDGKEMAYTAPDGIFVVDLSTWNTRQVVKGKVRTIEVGHKTPSVFYIKPEERALYVTNIDTGETRKLATLPERGSIGTINADETLAAGTYIEGNAGQDYGGRGSSQDGRGLVQPANKGQMMEQRLAAHLPLVLFTVNLQTGEMKTLLHSTDWVNHLLFSPTDPELLMYCHEGPWQKVDRIWTIHTDGTHNTLIHKRTMFMEIAGHEFWDHDGETIWYDWQTPKGEDFWLAGYSLTTGKTTPTICSATSGRSTSMSLAMRASSAGMAAIPARWPMRPTASGSISFIRSSSRVMESIPRILSNPGSFMPSVW